MYWIAARHVNRATVCNGFNEWGIYSQDMICAECIESLKVWQTANEDLCRITTILTAYATAGDQLKFDEYSIRAEDARLRAENARTLLELHRNTHDLIPSALKR
jgi:hypothetical protein